MNRRLLPSLACALVSTLASTLVPAGAARASEPFPASWFGDNTIARRLEGTRAKEFELAEWVGEPKSLHTLRGKIVVLDFWAEWCPFCHPFIATDAQLAEKYADQGVEIIAIHDGSGIGRQNWNAAKARCSDYGVRFSHGLDLADRSKSMMAKYGLNSFPTYVIIDREGTVRAVDIMPKRIDDAIKQLLAETPAPVTTPEFPFACYVGGENRARELQALESRPAASLSARDWIGAPTDIRPGGIYVLQFFSLTHRPSLRTLETLAGRKSELAAQGATLIAVAAASNDWTNVQQRAQSKGWSIPVMLDQMPSAPAPSASPSNPSMPDPSAPLPTPDDLTLGVTTDAYRGAAYYPTIVIDRRGIVRAAGVRADKVLDVVQHIALNPEPQPFQPGPTHAH